MRVFWWMVAHPRQILLLPSLKVFFVTMYFLLFYFKSSSYSLGIYTLIALAKLSARCNLSPENFYSSNSKTFHEGNKESIEELQGLSIKEIDVQQLALELKQAIKNCLDLSQRYFIIFFFKGKSF